MHLEKINIALAIVCVAGLAYIIYIWRNRNKKTDVEQFYYSDKCQADTQKYCNQLKSGSDDVFGTPGVLSDMMQSCGGFAYPDVQNCYPEWATIRGGTEKKNIDLILKQVTNQMY